MTTHFLANALPIGGPYAAVSLGYCPDDNTYTEVPIVRTAWACAVRSQIPAAPLGDEVV